MVPGTPSLLNRTWYDSAATEYLVRFSYTLPLKQIVEALLALVPLEALPRTGWVQRGIAQPECIAGHLVGTTLVALALAPRVEPPLNVDRVVALAAVHDAPEALLGDLPMSAKRLLGAEAKQAAEERAAREVLGPLSETALERFLEAQEGSTREAQLARLCDKLQLGLRLLAYRKAGQGNLDEFIEGLCNLDCSAFEPAVEFQRELLAALQ
ncbi:MAG TPA: HD domain-containing protein [Planctomycetes bacterium]|nr:HD domain-containing protein [Planctomycetota bacterium]HIL52669.1 HD domain-containing protein [Planctomycetota bacterium]